MKKLTECLEVLNHIAQIVLCFVAVVVYFYTVKPIYQKELLSEQIAHQQLLLEKIEKRVFTNQIKDFIFYTSTNCSGIEMLGPIGGHMHSGRFIDPQGSGDPLDINISDCLLNSLNDAQEKFHLSGVDESEISEFNSAFKKLIPILEEKRKSSKKAYEVAQNQDPEELQSEQFNIKLNYSREPIT